MISYNDVRWLHIEASSHCNASCPVCSRNYHGGSVYPWIKPTHLTLPHHQKFLTNELLEQMHGVNYCGNLGDPVINPDFFEICSWLLSINPELRIKINTNGGSRDPQFWTSLGKLFKGKECDVTFSVDGLEDTNQVYRRGVRWSKVISAMRCYSDAGGKAIWEFLVFKHNEHQIEEARQLSKEIGIAEFHPKKAMGFVNQGEGQAIDVLKKNGELEYRIYPPGPTDFRNDALGVKKALAVEKRNTNVRDLYTASAELTARADLEPMYEKHLNKCQIDCRAQKDKVLFISSQGILFPCCYTASRYFAPNKNNFINNQVRAFFEKKGIDQLSLLNRSFKEILEDPWFQNALVSTWKIKDVKGGKMGICAEICASGLTELKSSRSHLESGR